MHHAHKLVWITDSTFSPGFQLSWDVVALIKRGFHAIDILYALARWEEAEHLDHLMEELLDDLDGAGDELDTESADILETGIEDYELDETADEGAINPPLSLEQYWEPDMLVASDSGF